MRTSTPVQSSETEQKRVLLHTNVEHLTTEIRNLRVSEDSFDDNDLLLLDYATDIARSMPCNLEGTYDHCEPVSQVLLGGPQKKSRRLAGLQPTSNELKDEKEKKDDNDRNEY